jgi:hypothetical protein
LIDRDSIGNGNADHCVTAPGPYGRRAVRKTMHKRSEIQNCERRMAELRTRLSSKGFENVHFDQVDDFDFIVGKHHCRCSQFAAAFLSPKISRLRLCDPTITSYLICGTSNPSHIESLVALCRGSAISIDSSNKSELLSISRELENSELYLIVDEYISGESVTIANAVSRYITRKSLGVDCEREVEFISSHFYEIEKSKLDELDLFDFDAILSNKSLCILSEDSLFDMINDRGFDEFFELFGFVRFEFVSVDRIREFCEKSQDMKKDLNLSLSLLVWRQLCGRLILPVDISNVSRDSSRYLSRLIDFKSSSPLSGIISYLTSKHGGNVSDKNVVPVTASSVNGGAVTNAADLTADSFWFSLNEDNSWLRYDFKDMRIKPTHYSLRSRYNGGSNDHYPKNWIVEVSNDGSTWTTIDERRNNSDLKGGNLTRTFTVSPCNYCRFIQIKQQGFNWHSGNYYYFLISSFEIFGELRE